MLTMAIPRECYEDRLSASRYCQVFWNPGQLHSLKHFEPPAHAEDCRGWHASENVCVGQVRDSKETQGWHTSKDIWVMHIRGKMLAFPGTRKASVVHIQ